jgi:FimV-like protein
VTGEELSATVAQMKKAQAYAPGRQDLRLDLARLSIRMEDYAGARKLLQPISSQGSEPHIKQEAELLLARLQNFEEQRSLVETARQQNLATEESVSEETRLTSEVSEAPVMRRKKPTAAPSSGSEPTLQLHPPRGDKAAGVLVRIECQENGVALVVKSGGTVVQRRRR